MTAVATRELKFRVDRDESHEVAEVFAVTPGGEHKVAELFWNGGDWLFIACDKRGAPIADASLMRHIDVDPERRLHLNLVAEENLKGSMDRNETVNDALDAALHTMRRQFRDETWEDAILGAKLYARGWYPKWREL